ncbi:hypothetical protein BMH31_11060 [Leucobacter sp. OLIS6]|uniref:tetratricopeptide repeat protein n=1 Tax=Leucobacter sp. OLIS6 TaxID=1914921 RepID=UPI000C176C5D|nr:tetratricopeptide repeat protein [Leucobacter sp. OLIS6]PIJ01993.1 hypothetical protein BMH31_11060 [Leucobacter sp. OLIS6]
MGSAGEDTTRRVRRELDVAEALARGGDTDAAIAAYAELLPRVEEAFPHDRFVLAGALDRFSAVLSAAGRFDEMTDAQERAIRVAEGAGQTPENLARMRLSLGDRLRGNGRLDAAIRAYARAAETAEPETGTAHPAVVEAGIGMAECAADLGRHGDALRSYRWVVPAARRALGDAAEPTRRAEAGMRASASVRRRRIAAVAGAVLIAVIVGAVLWEQLA